MVTSLGIEPKLQSSQNCVLSVERRDQNSSSHCCVGVVVGKRGIKSSLRLEIEYNVTLLSRCYFFLFHAKYANPNASAASWYSGASSRRKSFVIVLTTNALLACPLPVIDFLSSTGLYSITPALCSYAKAIRLHLTP